MNPAHTLETNQERNEGILQPEPATVAVAVAVAATVAGATVTADRPDRLASR
jgi:hypothetical protein